MTAGYAGHAAIEGYEAPIKQALWSRIMTGGVPRTWAALWAAAGLYGALMAMFLGGFAWVLVPGAVWALGHATLVFLTLFDTHWDDIVIAQITRRYAESYDAG